MLNQLVEYSANPLDSTYAALSHPVRRAVLEQLRQGEAGVTELATPFAISLAAVSKHITVLEEAGLIDRAVHGRDHRLTLNSSPLFPAARWLDPYHAFWEERLDQLESQLKGRR